MDTWVVSSIFQLQYYNEWPCTNFVSHRYRYIHRVNSQEVLAGQRVNTFIIFMAVTKSASIDIVPFCTPVSLTTEVCDQIFVCSPIQQQRPVSQDNCNLYFSSEGGQGSFRMLKDHLYSFFCEMSMSLAHFIWVEGLFLLDFEALFMFKRNEPFALRVAIILFSFCYSSLCFVYGVFILLYLLSWPYRSFLFV